MCFLLSGRNRDCFFPDNVFLMAMQDADPKVAYWKIKAAYHAVVLFGRWSIIPRDDD